MKTPNWKFEKETGGLVAGVDEAGMGPLAGPVVAAAVIFKSYEIPDGINDSKKITAKSREALFGRIQDNAHIGVGLAEVAEIDCLNILGATKMAMLRAVENLNIIPDNILVDGNRPPKFPVPFLSIIKGDTLSFSIAAASIIAKVTRDRIMDGLHQEFPAFGWNKNRGYGTAAHQKAITDHGITIHHRRHFRYVREVYEQA